MGAKRWAFAIVCAAWVAAGLACGDSRHPGAGSGPTPPTGPSDAAGASDAAPPPPVCDASLAAVVLPLSVTTTFAASTSVRTAVPESWGAMADFRRWVQPWTVVVTNGPCSILDPVDQADAAVDYAAGGYVTFQVGDAGTTLATPSGYADLDPKASPFEPCDPIRVASSGDEAGVPAFALSATMPPRAIVTSPPIRAGVPLTVSRAQPLVLAWEGAAGAPTIVELAGIDSFQHLRLLRCVVDGAAGGVTIPTSLLSQLQTRPGGSPAATLSVETQDSARSTTADWTLMLGADVTANTPSGDPVQVGVVLE